MSTNIELRKIQKKSGIILFLVIGAIFVLTILVLSYNYLVHGKFNEQREILKHVRAMKCAQGITRFVINNLRYELSQPINSSSGISKLLKSKILPENDPVKLADKMNSEWLSKVNYSELLKKMLPNHLRQDASINVSVSFKDIVNLKSLAKGNELFFDFEKAGKMTIKTVIQIGKTREAWSEIRPFRVLVPYPMPITKFSLYLPEATTSHDPTKFNTVSISSAASGKTSPKSPQPLYLYNNSLLDNSSNKDKDIWQKRGWIYMGGGNILLNRAASNQKHGQRYFSYFPGANMPIALRLKFPSSTNPKLSSNPKVNNQSIDFRMARWGYAEALISGTSSGMWKQILKAYLLKHPPATEKQWWQSTCLHLFGDITRNRSITRVCGNVYDRFIELGYLIPSGSGNPPIAAIIGLSKSTFNKYSGKSRNWAPGSTSDIGKTFRKKVFIKDSLVAIAGPLKALIGVNNLDDMKDFFEALPYSTNGTGISFDKLMSKPDYCQYDETYKMISQYEQDSNKIGIPPSGDIPAVDNMKFDMDIPGLNSKNLQIDKISANLNTSMEKRVCYEIDLSNKKAKDSFKLIQTNFCRKQTNDFNLRNSVIKIKTNGKGVNLANNLGTHTGGTILSDGPIKIGTFRPNVSEIFNAPLVFIAKKGSITVNNSINDSTLGYLIALSKPAGQVKLLYPRKPLNLVGGIAANTLDPKQIIGGGKIEYNATLDPTSPSFANCVGFALGPAGGIDEK